FISPDLEADECIGPERRADRDVDGIATSCHQYSPDPRHVVARVEGMPAPSEVCLEPGGEVHRTVGRSSAHVAEIARAIPRGNIHASAKGDSEVCEIAADTTPLVERLPGCSGGTRVFVAERDVIVNEIADRLDSSPARGGLSEQVPSDLQKFFRIAVAARKEKNEGLFGQILYRMLLRGCRDDLGIARVIDDRGTRDPELSLGRDDATAPVAEAIAISGYGNGRLGDYMIRNRKVGCARRV